MGNQRKIRRLRTELAARSVPDGPKGRSCYPDPSLLAAGSLELAMRLLEKPWNHHLAFFHSSDTSVIPTLSHDWHMTTNQALVYFIYDRNILDWNLPREIQHSNP